MKELILQLGNIEDAYDDFILGVINYAKRDSSHVIKLLKFIEQNDNITSSDVIEFIAEQPDFNDYNNSASEKVS